MIDSTIYEGPFKNDLFHGFGKLTFLDSSTFEGVFLEGRCPKIGRKTFEGDAYEGELDEFDPQGLGRMRHKDGAVYEG